MNEFVTATYIPVHKPFVKQHWNLTFGRQRRMSVMAKRILACVLNQVQEDDFELRRYYQFDAQLITDAAEINRRYAHREVEEALRELAATTWECRDPVTNRWQIWNLLDTTQPVTVGYHYGLVTALLNPQLKPFFISLAHYSLFELEKYLKLRSWYSQRLYELLSAFRDTGVWEVDILTYRDLMDCGPQFNQRGKELRDEDGGPKLKYPKMYDLLHYTLELPQKELSETDLQFRVEHIHQQIGAGKPKVCKLRFELIKGPVNRIPAWWAAHPQTAGMISELRLWKVTEANIKRYAPALKQEGVSKLLRDWQVKQRSEARIDSVVKYCNAVFVRAGKQAMQELREAKEEVKRSSSQKG